MNLTHPDVVQAYYKAWRATARDGAIDIMALVRTAVTEKPRKYAGTGRYKRTAAHKEATRKGALKRWATPSKRARHAVTSYWATLTPEQRSERQRKAAKKMWKRRKAEAR